MKKLNTGCALRNKPDITVWICGEGFVWFSTLSRSLNGNNENNFNFSDSCIHSQNLITPNSFTTNYGVFLWNTKIHEKLNISETTHLCTNTSNKLSLVFTFQICTRENHEKNIHLVSNTFLGHPVYFQTILECSSNGCQSFHVETKSEILLLRYNRAPRRRRNSCITKYFILHFYKL